MRGLDDKEQPLPGFQGAFDETLQTKVYDTETAKARNRRMLCGGFIVTVCLLTVASIMAFYTMLGNMLQKEYRAGFIASAINAGSIIVFNALYKQLAAWLTEIENNRTETMFQDSLIIECFLFQFINSYFSLYIVAFIKPFSIAGHNAGAYDGVYYNATEGNVAESWFGTCSCTHHMPSGCYDAAICNDVTCSNLPVGQCTCTHYGCGSDVGYLLLNLFGIQIVVGNVLEIIVPQISFYVKDRLANSGEDQAELNRSQAELEAVMPDYEEFVYTGLFDDFNEIALQFGFVTLFAPNFPLVGVLAFINNVVEIRSDSYKFINVYRRPNPRPAENIGSWYTVMEVMTFAAVSTNCANVFLVSEFATDLTWTNKVLGLFVSEHCAYAIKMMIAMYIPDISDEIQRQIDYEEYDQLVALTEGVMKAINEECADELHLYRDEDAELENIPVDSYYTMPQAQPEPSNELVGIGMSK